MKRRRYLPGLKAKAEIGFEHANSESGHGEFEMEIEGESTIKIQFRQIIEKTSDSERRI